MPTPPILMLHNGGLRSLVATAVVLSEHKPALVHLLHLRDARPNAARRLDHLRRQARQWGVRHVRVLDLTPIPLGDADAQGQPTARMEYASPALHQAHLLLVAMACGLELGAERIIWPCQHQGDFDAISRATEQTVLVQALAQLERREQPAIDTPLLELDDRRVLELGAHLGVPWELAWSCLLGGDTPCRACNGCRRRHLAFEAAGLADPIEQPAPAR